MEMQQQEEQGIVMVDCIEIAKDILSSYSHCITSFVFLFAFIFYYRMRMQNYRNNAFPFPDHAFSKSTGIANRKDRFHAVTSNIDGNPYKVGDLLPFPLSDYFLNKDGLYIYTKRWLPMLSSSSSNTLMSQDEKNTGIDSNSSFSSSSSKPKAIVILVHGVGEHLGRYTHVAKAFTEKGYAVYGNDHQGHGKSEGDRTYVKNFYDFADDVILVTNRAIKEYPNVPVFLLGHSLGGLIAICVAEKAQKLFKAAVFSAPALDPTATKIEKEGAYVIQKFAPKMHSKALEASLLCHDPLVVDLYQNDPLVVHVGPSAHLSCEVLDTAKHFVEDGGAKNILLPYMLIRGTADQICLRDGIAKFHEQTLSTKKKFVELDGLYHEIYNEKGFEALKLTVKFFGDILSGDQC